MSSRLRRLAFVAVPLVGLTLLTACGGPSVTVGSEPPSSFTTPVWALSADPVGEWLTSASTDDIRVDVYQAGVEPATEDSAWAFTDTDEPLFVSGDPIVVLHLVLTNTGDEDVVLSSGTPDVSANYTSLDLSSLPAENRFGDIVDSLGISQDAPIDHEYSIENDYRGVTADGWDMPIAPGESVAWPAVYMYLADGGFTLRVRVWTYANGQFSYSNTTFDSGDVKIPLK